MSGWAAQALELATGHFPRALLTPEMREALHALPPALADASPLDFECRLGSGGGAIDVSQHFHAGKGGAGQLQALADARAAALAGPLAEAWGRIGVLARRWSGDEYLAGAMVGIGLEHDCGPGAEWVDVPAIFAAFDGGVLHQPMAAASFLELVSPEALPALDRLLAALEAAERHHMESGRLVGVMLSRGGELRSMVRKVQSGRLAPFLSEIGWPGDAGSIEELLARSPLGALLPTLVLGFAPDIMPDCGFEIISPAAQLQPLLEWLVETELADPERVEAALAWRGALTPLNCATEWPDATIARGIAGAPDQVEIFSRWLNHLKLNVVGGRVQSAKAYLTLNEEVVAPAHA